MFEQFMGEATTVIVLLVTGGIFWSAKPFWAKALGGVFFLAAALAAISSPTLLSVAIAAIAVFLVAKAWLSWRKKTAKQRKEEKEREAAAEAIAQAVARQRADDPPLPTIVLPPSRRHRQT